MTKRQVRSKARTKPFAPPPYEQPVQLTPVEEEAVVVAEILDGATPAEAGRAAGLSAQGAGLEVARRPHVREVLLTKLEELGAGPSRLAEVLRDGLNAVQSATYQGAVYTSTVPDAGMRLSYADRLLRLHGVATPRDEPSEDSWEAVLLAVRARRAKRDDP